MTITLSPRATAAVRVVTAAGAASLVVLAARSGDVATALRWCQDRLVASAWSANDARSAFALAALGTLGAVAAVRASAFVLSEAMERARLERDISARALSLSGTLLRAKASVAADFAVALVDDVRPYAFSLGVLRPRIVISRGLASRCSLAELRAVLAHEAAHCRARHPLSAAFWEGLRRSAFVAPAIADLVEHFRLARELAADAAAEAAAGRRALASAMLKATHSLHGGHATAAFGMLGDRAAALAASSRDAPLRLGIPRILATIALVSAFTGLAATARAGTGRDSPDLCASDVPAMSTINFSPYLTIVVPQMSVAPAAPGLSAEARP